MDPGNLRLAGICREWAKAIAHDKLPELAAKLAY